jgi:5'-nucleotidase
MPVPKKAQILLTNDDGIQSPGLWAAAEVLERLGFVTVVAPRNQQSGAGRGFPSDSDGIIREDEVHIKGKAWKVYAVGGSPAQAVQHGILEVMERKPDLVVAGINFGENVGTGVTISGTVGAALEGAACGAPALAVSLETEVHHHRALSNEVDFRVAAYFTELFADLLLRMDKQTDVDVLKVEIPASATRETEWKMTRISREKAFIPVKPERKSFKDPARLRYRTQTNTEKFKPGTDAYTIKIEKVVSVTPLSLDLTSRFELSELENRFRNEISEELNAPTSTILPAE